ncbi:MAG: hypothetical protein H6698_03625 [Myxococcales bacterium]|nr:hypothetical protein [Myxococcales bacterium]
MATETKAVQWSRGGGRGRRAWLVAASLSALAAASCRDAAPNEASAPEFAFRAFRDALAAGDTATVWAFLGPETRARLTAAATAYPGESRPEPATLLVTAWVPRAADIASIERVTESDTEVVLRVRGQFGAAVDVPLTRNGERWTVELVAPAGAGGHDG